MTNETAHSQSANHTGCPVAHAAPRTEPPPPVDSTPGGPRGARAAVLNAARMQIDHMQFLIDLVKAYGGSDLRPIRFSAMGQPIYFLQNPRHIERAFKDGDTYVRLQAFMRSWRETLGHSLVTVAQMDVWHEMRLRTMRYFNKQSLHKYAQGVIRTLDRHTMPMLEAKARSGEPIDAFSEMLGLAALAAFVNFVGVDLEEVPEDIYLSLNEVFCFLRERTFSAYFVPMWVPTAANNKTRQNLARVHGFLQQHIDRKAAQDTMFADVIRAHTDAHGRLDLLKAMEEITSNLVGASETTIVLMAWTLYYLVQEPEVTARAVAEIDRVLGDRAPTAEDLPAMAYVDCIIREALRLRSPAYVTARATQRETMLDGYRLEKGALVMASQFITHRDPRLWDRPERFLPERFQSDSRGEGMKWFPFGGGQYFCVGMQYAINEAKLMVVALLQRFAFRIHDPHTFAQIGVDPRLTLRPNRPILLRVQRRETP